MPWATCRRTILVVTTGFLDGHGTGSMRLSLPRVRASITHSSKARSKPASTHHPLAQGSLFGRAMPSAILDQMLSTLEVVVVEQPG